MKSWIGGVIGHVLYRRQQGRSMVLHGADFPQEFQRLEGTVQMTGQGAVKQASRLRQFKGAK
jgi:hypothetical protein